MKKVAYECNMNDDVMDDGDDGDDDIFQFTTINAVPSWLRTYIPKIWSKYKNEEI